MESSIVSSEMNIPILKKNKMKLSACNALLGPKKSLYDKLIIRGDYLPDKKSPCITKNYLLQVLYSHVFRIKRKEKKVGYMFKKVSKIQLIEILDGLTEKELGFDEFNTPDKNWLVNTIYTLNENHDIFKYEIEEEPETEIDLS